MFFFHQETQRGPPSNINYTDKANFHVVVNSSDVQKKKFLVSVKLSNKLDRGLYLLYVQ